MPLFQTDVWIDALLGTKKKAKKMMTTRTPPGSRPSSPSITQKGEKSKVPQILPIDPHVIIDSSEPLAFVPRIRDQDSIDLSDAVEFRRRTRGLGASRWSFHTEYQELQFMTASSEDYTGVTFKQALQDLEDAYQNLKEGRIHYEEVLTEDEVSRPLIKQPIQKLSVLECWNILWTIIPIGS